VKVTVTFEVSEATEKLVLQCSLERVINTSIKLIDGIECEKDDAAIDQIDTNLNDWTDCKYAASHLWNALRDGVFRAKTGEMKQVRDWEI